jgi:hypothetical protein
MVLFKNILIIISILLISCSNENDDHNSIDTTIDNYLFYEDFSNLDRWQNEGWSLGTSKALNNPPYALFYNSGAFGDELGSLSTKIDLNDARELIFSFNGDYKDFQFIINGYIVSDYDAQFNSNLVKIRLTGLELSTNADIILKAFPKEYYQISIDDIIFK